MSTKVEPWPANRRNRLQLLTSAVRVKHDRVAGRRRVCHSSGGFVSGGNSTLQPTELPIACVSVSALWPGPSPHPRAPLARSLPDRVSRLVRGISPLGAEAGRGDWIRTSDLFVPNEARYQAAPRPDRELSMASSPRMLKQRRRPGRRSNGSQWIGPWMERGGDDPHRPGAKCSQRRVAPERSSRMASA